MTEKQQPHRAGLFDIRMIIAGLIGIYGLILVPVGFFTSDAEQAKADGLNINIIAGIVMILFAAAFVAWARIRPIVVPPEPKATGEADPDDEADRPVH